MWSKGLSVGGLSVRFIREFEGGLEEAHSKVLMGGVLARVWDGPIPLLHRIKSNLMIQNAPLDCYCCCNCRPV